MITLPEDEKQLNDITRLLEDKRQTVISIEADYIRLQGCVRTEQNNLIALSKERTDLENQINSLKDKISILSVSSSDLENKTRELTETSNKLTDQNTQSVATHSARESELKDREENISLKEREISEQRIGLNKALSDFSNKSLDFEGKVNKLKEVVNIF